MHLNIIKIRNIKRYTYFWQEQVTVKAAVLTSVTARRDGRIHLKERKEKKQVKKEGQITGSQKMLEKQTNKQKTQNKTHLIGEALMCKLFTSYLQSNTQTLELVV